jgi:cell division protein ZapA
MKTAVAVTIAGQRFTLRSDEDEGLVRDMAAHVDRRLRELQKQTRAADTQSLAILAALQITEDLWRERRDHAELRRQVRDKGRALLQFIERESRV